MKKRFFLLLSLFICMPFTADADSMTFGGIKFNFDLTPMPQLTVPQKAFFDKYKSAVNQHSEAALMALIDASSSGCANLPPREVLLRDLKYPWPDDAKVIYFPVPEKDFAQTMGMGDMAYLPAKPTAIFGIDTPRTMILQPVRQVGDSITLIPYCLTDKGVAAMKKKDAAQAK